MKHFIAQAANTVVPAVLALEGLGFVVTVEKLGGREQVRAARGGESYLAEDPVAVLGLVTLVQVRGWAWQAEDREIDQVSRRFGWTGHDQR